MNHDFAPVQPQENWIDVENPGKFTHSMKMLLFLALTSALVVFGCARNKKARAISNSEVVFSGTNALGGKVIVTPADGLNGKISSANLNLRFVVVTFPIGQMPAPNQHLYVYRDGLKIGELNVTGPQRADSTVADIVTGEAQLGDQVRDK
jgi:hypothetical protein